MAYDLTGKAIQRLELAVTNSGYNSLVKVIMAKKNDVNSRFLHVILHDAKSTINCAGCTVQFNATLPDGTPLVSYGELIKDEIYVKIPGNALQQVGRVTCDISVIGAYNELVAGVGESTGINGVEVDKESFSGIIQEGGYYTFRFEEGVWKLDGSPISLSSYGISVTGTAIEGDTIVIDYSTSYTLTSESFYLLVQESNYDENAELGITESSFMDYVKAQMGDIKGEISIIKAISGTDLYLDMIDNKIYLLNSEDQIIGNGITLPATVNGFVTETDENGNTYLYLAYDGEIIGDGILLPSGGGGGSGGSSYVVRVINNLGTTVINAAAGQPCMLNFTVAEYYGQDQTNTKAIIAYMVRKPNEAAYVTVKTETVDQGVVERDVSEYLAIGNNSLRVVVTGGESGITKSTTYTVAVTEISMTSSFNHERAYNSNFNFLYKCQGKGISKTVHFEVDGEEYCEPIDVGTSHNVQLSQTIDLSSYGHGSHKLEVYFVTSSGARCPSLIYDVIYYVAPNNTPIISSTFDVESVTYGNDIEMKYIVYTYGSDYTASLDRTIYTYQYLQCDEGTEGALKVIDNNAAVGENEIHIEDLDIPTINLGDYVVLTKVIFSTSTLTNLINAQEQTWIIQEYPEQGEMFIELKAGVTTKTFRVFVNEIDTEYELEPVTTRLVAALNTNGRSNSDVARTTWRTFYNTIDGISTTIAAELEDFDFVSNGWVTDDDNSPTLRHSGIAKTTIALPILATNYKDTEGQNVRFAGSPSDAGRTIEIEFNVHDVTDYNAEIIKCYDADRGTGFVITPRYAYMLANTMTLEKDEKGNITNLASVPALTFKDGERIRISFVIENVGYFKDGDTNKQLVRIYINGELSKALNYSDSSLFGNTSNIVIGNETCITDIYSIRAYDMALEDSQVLTNYIADKNSVNEKLALHKDNDILNATGEIDYYACMKKLPCILITGKLSGYKGDKTKVGIYFTKPSNSTAEGYTVEMDCMEKLNGEYICQSNVQGTSSQRYAKKNYKFTFKNIVNGEAKKSKYKLKGDESIGEDTLCYKADYMSPNHPNTPNANYLSSLFTELVPPQEEDDRVQITIYGYRCLLFQRDSETDTPVFHGDGFLNNDKGNTATFGLENDTDEGNNTKCQKWEFLDNSEDICNFKTDRLFEPRGTSLSVVSALESSYPDQGDLEDAGLTPDYSHIQILYTWVCQRANYWTADKDTILETPLEYNGATYNTEYDYKKAIFENEFEKHFNKNHALTYYLGVEAMALVDNRAKNMFLSCYDVSADHIVFTDESITSINDIIDSETGAVDASKIDWENSTFAIWYTSLYDLDSCLGVDNSGYNVVPYDAEWDFTLNSQKIFNGSESYLWQMIETSMGNDIATLYKKLRDEYKTLSYAKMYDAHITNNADLVCPTIVNKDERFKYIDIWTEGYQRYSDDNSTQSLVKTPDYLYLVQGSKRHQISSFMFNRMNMLDSKYINATFRQNKVEMRIGLSGQTEGQNVGLTLTPVTTMYCRAEYGNSGEYLGDKTEAGKSINIVPVDGDYGDILLTVFGASNLASLGDLSKLKPYSVDVSSASKLRELIIGSAEEGYENPRLTSLDVSACKLLQKIDIRNTGISNTLDLSKCSLIEEVYANGSKISELSLPKGGYLQILHLPNTITTFIMRDQIGLTEFSMEGADSLQTLVVENCSTPVMVETAHLLRDGYAHLTGGIRLTGINWDLTSTGLNWTKEEAIKLLNGLASDDIKGKQVNALGTLVDDESLYPVITGEIYVGSLVNANELVNFEIVPSQYPNLKVWSWEVQWKDRFDNVVETEYVLNGATAHPSELIETEYEEDGTVYKLTSWSVDYSSVTNNIEVSPIYSKVWAVRFIDGKGNVLKTEEVIDGQNATAPEEIPENYTDGTYKYTFKTWNKSLENISADTDITAIYDIYWTVNWVGHNDEILKTENVIDGNGATPPDVEDYTEDGKVYTFQSWDSAYAVIRADMNINAIYTTKWIVTWQDYDGRIIKTEEVLNGMSATPPTEELTRASTVQYVYTHTGWDKAYTMITNNTTITAKYTESLQSYPVKFYSDMGLADLLYTGAGNYDGTCMYSGEALVIPDGYFFMGWKDTYGNSYDSNLISLGANNCRITTDGTPIEIELYAIIEIPVPGLPQTQKDAFSEFTWMEIKAISNAIVAGTTDEVTVTYNEAESSYSVYEVATGITSVVALHDTKDMAMEDGTVQTMEVADFLHDEDEYGNKLGISLVTKHLYKQVTQKHYSGSHALMHYKVNDVEVTENTVNYTHTQGDADGSVVIESTGDTYINELILTDASGFITTWRFHSTTGTDDDTHKYYKFTKDDNVAIGTTKTWNGIAIDASKGAFTLPDYYSQYFVSAEPGCKLTIPVTAGSTLVIKGYSSYNLGGWEYSSYRKYLNETIYPLIPSLLRGLISAAKKGSSIGGCAYDVRYFYDKVWALSTAELGWSTTSKPYKDEGSKYPIFTDNASRIKKYNNGEGSAGIWWLRSPYYDVIYHFYIVYSSGDWDSDFASYARGVAFGFAL